MSIKNQRSIIITLGALSALGPFSIDMYLPGFPAISKDLNSPIAHVALSLTSFFIGISVGQLLYGPVIDRFGRKIPLYVGLIIYLLSSVGCMLAPDVDTLIALRLLQALGGCAGMVVSKAMVRDVFPVEDNAKVFSMLMLVMGVAPIIAPTIGGMVTEEFGWRVLFFILIIISALMLFCTYRFLPESKQPDKSISLAPKAVFAEYLEVLKEPLFVTYVFAGGISAAGMFAYISASPFVFIELFGLSEKQFGWLFGFNAFGLIAASQVNSLLLKKYSSEIIVYLVSIVQVIAAIALFSLTFFGWLGFGGTFALIFIYLAMQGFIFPNTSALGMRPFNKNAGSASALMGSLQMVFGALASAGVSALHDNTALPMTGIIAFCAIISLLSIIVGTKMIGRVSKSRDEAVFVK